MASASGTAPSNSNGTNFDASIVTQNLH